MARINVDETDPRGLNRFDPGKGKRARTDFPAQVGAEVAAEYSVMVAVGRVSRIMARKPQVASRWVRDL